MDIEMVKKKMYIQVLEVIYTTSNVTLYTKEQLIKQLNIPMLDYKICPI